ncbi:MAG: cytochrome c3 family protein, partial [Phycisphaerales bacterium]
MITRRCMPLAPLLALAISAAHAQPQPAPALPTTRVLNCTTSGCHAKQQNYPFLHGPNAVQACDACHEYVDPAKHTFQMKRPGRNLCDFCHIDKTGTEGTFVHDPVAKGECATCHDPHGETTRKLLKNDSIVQLCTQCHKTVNSAAHIHKPAQEDCRLCH